MMERPATEGGRIQSVDTNGDESAAQVTTMPARAARIRYVHKRQCRALMPASCRCRSPKRRVYSLSGISCTLLVKASRPANSEVFIDTPSPYKPRSLILCTWKTEGKDRATSRQCFSSRGLQRGSGWRTLKERRETRFILKHDGRP